MRKRSQSYKDPKKRAADKRNNVEVVDGDITKEDRKAGINLFIVLLKSTISLKNNNLCLNWNTFESERGYY